MSKRQRPKRDIKPLSNKHYPCDCSSGPGTAQSHVAVRNGKRIWHRPRDRGEHS